MTIDEFIQRWDGKKVGDGQCGNLVRQYWIEIDKTSPPSYVSSKDYWFNPVPGYNKVSSPQKGDIAIYNGHGTFVDGHSAIYYDGRVFEQNADPDGSPAHLFNRANTYLLGYLRKQGQGGNMPITTDQLYSLIRGITQREPTQAEVTNQKYLDDPGFAIDTFWNNSGKQLYENPPPTEFELAPTLYVPRKK